MDPNNPDSPTTDNAEVSQGSDKPTLMADAHDLVYRFALLKPADSVQAQKATMAAQAFLDLAVFVSFIVPVSRERSIVLTKLEEASHFAIRGLLRCPLGKIDVMPNVPGDDAQPLPRAPWMNISATKEPDETAEDAERAHAAEQPEPDAPTEEPTHSPATPEA